MSVTGIGYVVHNKARVALERALRNPRKRVLGVEWELILTFGFSPQRNGSWAGWCACQRQMKIGSSALSVQG
jgi:hypothetical protein